jgi:hypothetical protein
LDQQVLLWNPTYSQYCTSVPVLFTKVRRSKKVSEMSSFVCRRPVCADLRWRAGRSAHRTICTLNLGVEKVPLCADLPVANSFASQGKFFRYGELKLKFPSVGDAAATDSQAQDRPSKLESSKPVPVDTACYNNMLYVAVVSIALIKARRVSKDYRSLVLTFR